MLYLKQAIKFYFGRICYSTQNFVPKHKLVPLEQIELLQNFLLKVSAPLVLTGAGISTESGIPDYRSEGVGLYSTSKTKPIQISEFVKSEKARKRYWARNYIAWPKFSSFHPNLSHRILANWEEKGKISHLVTQNVDKLHHKAGSKLVTELHGNAFQIHCMNCTYKISRYHFQNMLKKYNSKMKDRIVTIRPDGDVELEQAEVDEFKVPTCPNCQNGILKPNIVFFGDNVPQERVDFINDQILDSDSLLIIGTSLTVYSSYRIVLLAEKKKYPIAIVNIGPTRGDKNSTLKIDGKSCDVLSKIDL